MATIESKGTFVLDDENGRRLELGPGRHQVADVVAERAHALLPVAFEAGDLAIVEAAEAPADGETEDPPTKPTRKGR